VDRRFVIGADFGTDSARALIVDVLDGNEIAEATAGYPRWLAGKYQDAPRRMFRQHPLDYLEALTSCVRGALGRAGAGVRERIAALSVDATGSTPCPVDKSGVPLALLPEFSENPDAMFHLWKDHTAIEEAAEITRALRDNRDGVDYTRYQGPYASEWYWAKILHTSRLNPDVRGAAWSWVEHSDWIPALLSGETRPERMYRSACGAGHKAYWHSAWGGLPSESCLGALDPYLVQVRRSYGRGPLPSTHALGPLTAEWARRLGLDKGVIVAGSSFDAHAGAVGAGVNGSTMVLNLGTSAVDMFAAPAAAFAGRDMAYAGGQAEDSIIPGLVGLEAGQSAFGDVYAWFKKLLLWPLDALSGSAAYRRELEENLLSELDRAAEALPIENGPAGLDWFNGRRYPFVNEHAQSAVTGLHMGTTAPEVYRALVASTAFGQKRILDAWAAEGIEPENLVAVGGIAQKSEFLMQLLADVLGRPIGVSKTRQACARGAAIYAAVASGLYGRIEDAQRVLCEGMLRTYLPDPERAAQYRRQYARYRSLSAFMDPGLPGRA